MALQTHPFTYFVAKVLLVAGVVGLGLALVAGGAFLFVVVAIWIGGFVALVTGLHILWVPVSVVLGSVLLFVYFDLIASFLQA